MKLFFLPFTLLFCCFSSYAGWHNTTGKITHINFYAHTNTVLLRLDSSGHDVAECTNKDYFAVNSTMAENRRNQMISALLAAKAMGKTITIAYNQTGSCAAYGSNTSAYRSILRVIM